MLDGYFQLLLPFYQETWQGPYLRFADDLITTVREGGAPGRDRRLGGGERAAHAADPNAFPVFLRSRRRRGAARWTR